MTGDRFYKFTGTEQNLYCRQGAKKCAIQIPEADIG